MHKTQILMHCVQHGATINCKPGLGFLIMWFAIIVVIVLSAFMVSR